jgi:ribulose-5-phosphate 4-epimerase/fuculose-1-phosphate aldolase
MTDDEVHSLKVKIAQSCRVLASRGLVREITGHVSARIPDTSDILIRCRHRQDPGVALTTAADIRRVNLDGESDDLGDDYKLPGEFRLHSELYRTRADIGAVVHGHPRASLLVGIMNLTLRPVIGAYDPAAMLLALDGGVPVFPRAVLIHTPELGQAVAASMGARDACLLKGHGFVVSGVNVEDATVRSVKLDTLAEVTLQTESAGHPADSLPAEDIEEIVTFLNNGGWNMMHILWTWELFLRELGEAGRVERDSASAGAR